MAQLTISNSDLPKWLQLNRSVRRFGTKLIPYVALILVAFVLEMSLWFVYKGLLMLAFAVMIYGCGV